MCGVDEKHVNVNPGFLTSQANFSRFIHKSLGLFPAAKIHGSQKVQEGKENENNVLHHQRGENRVNRHNVEALPQHVLVMSLPPG